MALKVCIEPGCWNATPNTRCTPHQQARDRARNADPARKPRRTAAYMKSVIGGPCACCGATEDLTRHHPDPIARAGLVKPFDPALIPMCRSCNSSIGWHVMESERCPQHGGVIDD